MACKESELNHYFYTPRGAKGGEKELAEKGSHDTAITGTSQDHGTIKTGKNVCQSFQTTLSFSRRTWSDRNRENKSKFNNI